LKKWSCSISTIISSPQGYMMIRDEMLALDDLQTYLELPKCNTQVARLMAMQGCLWEPI
jgi:hypothetical protein